MLTARGEDPGQNGDRLFGSGTAAQPARTSAHARYLLDTGPIWTGLEPASPPRGGLCQLSYQTVLLVGMAGIEPAAPRPPPAEQVPDLHPVGAAKSRTRELNPVLLGGSQVPQPLWPVRHAPPGWSRARGYRHGGVTSTTATPSGGVVGRALAARCSCCAYLCQESNLTPPGSEPGALSAELQRRGREAVSRRYRPNIRRGVPVSPALTAPRQLPKSISPLSRAVTSNRKPYP
jgi:hypothetical protein